MVADCPNLESSGFGKGTSEIRSSHRSIQQPSLRIQVGEKQVDRCLSLSWQVRILVLYSFPYVMCSREGVECASAGTKR